MSYESERKDILSGAGYSVVAVTPTVGTYSKYVVFRAGRRLASIPEQQVRQAAWDAAWKHYSMIRAGEQT